MNQQFHSWIFFFFVLAVLLKLVLVVILPFTISWVLTQAKKKIKNKTKHASLRAKHLLPAIYSIVYVAVFMHSYYLLVLKDK